MAPVVSGVFEESVTVGGVVSGVLVAVPEVLDAEVVSMVKVVAAVVVDEPLFAMTAKV